MQACVGCWWDLTASEKRFKLCIVGRHGFLQRFFKNKTKHPSSFWCFDLILGGGMLVETAPLHFCYHIPFKIIPRHFAIRGEGMIQVPGFAPWGKKQLGGLFWMETELEERGLSHLSPAAVVALRNLPSQSRPGVSSPTELNALFQISHNGPQCPT